MHLLVFFCHSESSLHGHGSIKIGKIDILIEKKYFLLFRNLRLLSQVAGNSINNCDFFMSVISVPASHCLGRQKG
jgi:hypothetical protein